MTHQAPAAPTAAVTIMDGFPELIEGELIFCHQDSLNTDGIFPGKYTYIDDFRQAQQAAVVMENYDPDFGALVTEGDILVGWYDFGTGDIGNDGIHELDLAVWGLGVDSHPARVSGYGSKMHFDDDQQFPDTQYVTCEYPGSGDDKPKLLVYEQRIWSPYVQEGHENGNAFYGTEGYMILSKMSGWQLYGEKNRLIRQEKGEYSVPQHVGDFLDSIRANRRPHADIEVGHRSAVPAHLANILARTGEAALRFDPEREQIIDNPAAAALVRRTYREGHWAVPNGV